MSEPRANKPAVNVSEHVEAGDFARSHDASGAVAGTGRTDAVNSGIVRPSDRAREAMRRGTAPLAAVARTVRRNADDGTPEGDFGDESVDDISNLAVYTRQGGAYARQARNSAAKGGTSAASGKAGEGPTAPQGAAKTASGSPGGIGEADAAKAAPRNPAKPNAGGAAESAGKAAKAKKKAESKRRAAAAKQKMQTRRAWRSARSAQAAATRTASTTAKAGGTKVLAATGASSFGLPVLGVICGIIASVIAIMAVAQLVGALFGFWENEEAKRAVAGLPPYITYEMVETALECQEEYGHPAGCTIAQIICESGMGDHLSGLATQDNNLFGIKWASSFASCPEVSGKSSYATQEEYGGETVTIMADFTSFKSYKDCIVFRSRVLLANDRYAGNALIQEAIANHDSDKMAEGLKDAGYATSSAYVDSLKSIMKTYNLYRFDGMTLDQFKSGTASGNAIVEAAHSQLGVPYVWGGSTPNVGLDCSGLTQWCYAQAGISIPRYSEDQATGGTKIPLSEARPGDILWRPGHVAIYIGGDQYIHEPQTGDVCKISNGISYFTCAVRYL